MEMEHIDCSDDEIIEDWEVLNMLEIDDSYFEYFYSKKELTFMEETF